MRTKINRIDLLVSLVARLAISCLPLAAAGQTARPHLSDAEVVRRIDAYVAPLAKHELSGTLLVARGNRILVERSFGLANYELGVRFTPATPTNIASITKPFQATITLSSGTVQVIVIQRACATLRIPRTQSPTTSPR